MATLLQAVNAVLKRHRLIHGASGDLASLTDSALQVAIDLSVAAWNEALIDLYLKADKAMPQEMGTGTLTLATSDRDYALASDVLQLRFPLIDTTNNQSIDEYPGGYEQIRTDQMNSSSSYTGLPRLAAFRPSDGQLYLDRIPTSAENGRAYGYIYDKIITLDEAADTLPFNAAVYQMMILPVTELVRRDLSGPSRFDQQMYDRNMARATELLPMKIRETSWTPDRIHAGMQNTDPLSD